MAVTRGERVDDVLRIGVSTDGRKPSTNARDSLTARFDVNDDAVMLTVPPVLYIAPPWIGASEHFATK